MKLLKSTASFGGVTLLSRIMGFARDVVLARFFGADAVMDAFAAAFRLPNLLRRIFAEGSFSLAFVPVFSEARERGDDPALRQLIDAVSGCLIAVLLMVTAIGVLCAPWIMRLVVPGFADEPGQMKLAGDLLRIMFPYLMLVSLTAMAAGILNTIGRFALPALTPVMLNLSIIVGAAAFSHQFDRPIMAVAWSVLIAGILQLLMLLPALKKHGLLPRPKLLFNHPGVRKIQRLMLPTLLGSSVAQINLLFDTFLASLLIAGSLSWLYYSERLMDFPLGIFGVALATVILPTLSTLHARVDPGQFRRTLEWALLLGMVIGVPAAVGLMLLAEPLMLTLFERGEFSLADAQWAGFSLATYCLGLPAFIAVKILAPAYFSRQDTVTPVKIALIALLSNMLMNVLFVAALLVYWTEPDGDWWQRMQSAPGLHAGLALASSAAGWINAGLLWRRLGPTGLQPSLQWVHVGRIVLAVIGMGLIVVWLSPPINQWQLADTSTRVLWCAAAVGSGAGAFGLLLLLLGMRKHHLIKPAGPAPQ
ncbi:MAG: murein biosynthesis integral membrane protein MurJ [Pseudomonadota bacterium]